MHFCTSHAKDLESAFAALSMKENASASSDAASNPPSLNMTACSLPSQSVVSPTNPMSSPSQGSGASENSVSANELSNILLALRKLREALLATSGTAPSPVFSQRVHVFCIRLAILACHPPSYHPPLLHLLFVLNTERYPLPATELSEMTSYLVLDMACRQGEMASAYSLRSQSKLRQSYDSRVVDGILSAVVTQNWVSFWRVRQTVDGYFRALMQWSVPELRRNTLKALGRAYMTCDLDWVLQSAAGGEMAWDELASKEKIGWVLEGSKVIIRKPKAKPCS